MTDLQNQLADLRAQIEALPSTAGPAQIAEVEQEARRLLTATKNTPYESEAQELFSRLAQQLEAPSAEDLPHETVNNLRNLLRRARIRIELAGDDDDVDEAIDILAEALPLSPKNPETQGTNQNLTYFMIKAYNFVNH